MSKCEGGARMRREVVRTSTLLAVVGLALFSEGCHRRAQNPGDLPDSPQAALEQQLLGRRDSRTSRAEDGGLLYTAEISAGNAGSLRVPYDLLKLECENHGGHFVPTAPPEKTAASLATDATPPGVKAVLQDADVRNLFGTHRCDAGEDTWFAELEPTELSPAKRPDAARVQLYAKADWPDDDEDGGAGPAGPGFPAVQAGVGELPPSEAGSLQPGAAGSGDAERKPVSPLDPQPSRPAASGDRLLADPRPFGLEPGSDDPSQVAQKLRIEKDKASPCNSELLTGLCWDHPGSEAEYLRAGFVELKSGPVLAELEVRYPATSHTWLARLFDSALGPSDLPAGGPDAARSWSWLHTIVELSQSGGATHLHVTHKPSLDRAQLPKNTPGREPLLPARLANPWQLQLGYEPAQSAQAKLQQAGFSVPSSGCSDGPSEARPVLVRTCPLRANLPHMRGAWVRSVDIGDGRARLAELGYQLDDATWKDSLRDLKAQHGEPIPSAGGALQWWTGPVGITLTPSDRGNSATLRYYHGRLLQYFIVAESRAKPSS